MKGTREFIFMGIGILTGFALCGPAAQAVDYLQAKPSSQPVYVDGQKVEMEAYFIHGNNFVKLRDIGKAVDFGVAYDAATNSVHIDPNAHYQEKVPTPVPSTGITEESVKAALSELRTEYPTGTLYGAFFRSYSNGPYGMAPSNCAGWATLCSDTAFGDLPWRRIENPRWKDIRPGDLIEHDNAYGGHVIVVQEKTDEYVKVTESGTNNKARWGGQYFKWWLEERPGYASYTRYPQ